ncbi:MAG: putative sulfate exporter family transporter [Deltaproteobacteria bacterium]|nr:MAG: putative sulfate exporter family transporter [Deltaproteobacteria bacterium]
MEGKKGISEDWLSFYLGLFLFILGLGIFAGVDLLGWGIKTSVWIDVSKALAPVSGELKAMAGLTSLFLTYLFFLFVVLMGAIAMGARIEKFVVGFTLVFWLSYLSYLLGHFAYIAAAPSKDMPDIAQVLKKFGIGWSLRLTGEAGLIAALIAGLLVGNFAPKFSETLKEATRPELYIKTAIVIMGAGLGVKAAESMAMTSAVMFRGLCAIIEAYLIYWAVVYFVARKYFKFSREWAAPLASGISICGVSAAIATGAAIRARPVVAIMVSSLVVIFAVVELIFLPFLASAFLWAEPLVAAAWMGLAVKTDGAAIASGAITESLIRAKALAQGVNYKEGWILMTTTTVKMFIDVFIGVWAFILAVIWCTKIECTGGRVKAIEIWERFPKFVIGYAFTFFFMLFLCLAQPGVIKTARRITGELDVFRGLFFVLTFFTIGVVSNFKKLWEEGIGRLAAVYVLCLFGFIIWVGLLISWIFFHGIKPL